MAKRKQKISAKQTSSTPPRFVLPAISVVIPMYNVERFIGACLDSLLAQTFQNFEVIIVDDCSTDNSVAIVQSYAEKFSGRLKLKKMLKNTGSGTEPRYCGLKYSCGKYVYFMDNDDALTPTALEELYTLAEKFDADVVYCRGYYNVPENFSLNDTELIKQLKPYSYSLGENYLVQEPTLWENNLEERVNFLAQQKIMWNYWLQLVRRDLLIKHSFKPVGIIADDVIFTICVLCCAKRYVVAPNVTYFYRQRADSLYHKKFSVDKHLNLWLTMLRDGFQYLDKFLDNYEFFSQRHDLRYALLNTFAQNMLRYFLEVYAKNPTHEVDKFLRENFFDSPLESFIFNTANVFHLNLISASQRINQLEQELQRLKG